MKELFRKNAALIYFFTTVLGFISFGFMFAAKRNADEKTALLERQYSDSRKEWQQAATDVLFSRGLVTDSNLFNVSPADLLRARLKVPKNYEISFQRSPNDECLTIHFNRRIAEHPEIFYNRRFLDVRTENTLAYLVAKSLFDVKGVESIDVDQYSVSLRRGKLFNWDSMIDQITQAISSSVPVEKG